MQKISKVVIKAKHHQELGENDYNPILGCLQETHLKFNNIGNLKVKDQKKIYQENINLKEKAIVTILIPDEIYFLIKKITEDKEKCYKTKKFIHQEDIKILSMCVQNNRASKYIKQKLTEVKAAMYHS